METNLVSQVTERRLSKDSVKILEALKTPLSIKVLTTSTCPFCAKVVDLVNQLAAAGPLIAVSIINVDLFPEVIQQYRPKAAPTTILNEEVFLTGVLMEKELVDWIQKVGTSQFLEQLYRNDLLEKRMESALKRLRNRPQDIRFLADLLKAEEFSIKLGAMAIFEQLTEEAPQLQGLILESLLPLLRNGSDQLVGDTAYLIGLLQDERKTAVLTSLLTHPNPEVVEAVLEGLAGK
jgi:hypothetical protein